MSASLARLLISCPDRAGIIATVTNFLFRHGANITCLDQPATEPTAQQAAPLSQRLQFDCAALTLSHAALESAFSEQVAQPHDMHWHITYAAQLPRMAILVSKYDHALLELLWRHAQGELPAQITQVISNHPDLERAVAHFGIPFKHIPVTKDTKTQAEQQILQALGNDTDLIVLARYMQVLSADFVAHYPQKIINIHHSFLPAFAGANPYKQAYDKGVKIIGATAHYVTADLDEGPIIEQAVGRVSHRHDAGDMMRLGRDLERQVLARAVQWHLEDRIVLEGARTIVFE